jgi:GAF domain-containing protein
MMIFIKFWKQISSIGVHADFDLPFQQRVRLSNQLSLIILLCALFFLTQFILKQEYKVAILMAVMASCSVMIMAFNYMRISVLARFILSLIPHLGTLASNISKKIFIQEEIGIIHYISPRLVMIASIIVPLILFTRKENLFLFFAWVIILVDSIFLFDQLHQYYHITYQDLGLETAALAYSMVYEDMILIAVIISLAMLFFRVINARYETQTQQLLEESEQKNNALKQRELDLKTTLLQLEEGRLKDFQNTWTATGLAQFADLLRELNQNEKFYARLLSEVVKYVEVHQGAFYSLKPDDDGKPMLQLKSTYAYGKEQMEKNQSFYLNEGLIGQTGATGKTQYLTQVPENYTSIASGLGQATPKYLLIVPLQFNQQLQGVLELASFEEFPPYKITFLDKLSETIGAFILNFRNTIQTQQLLDESQQMYQVMEQFHQEFTEKEQQYLDKIEMLEREMESFKILG